jgi:bifunctional non-homologous end joining protein LigD
MAARRTEVQVGKRRFELSNLDKVLYPGDGITKAQIIEYYLKVAPTILTHLQGRPLSLVRFPDGITQESFYQKSRPDWAPDWLEFVTLGTEQKDYIIATEDAALAFLANMAAIELHQMQVRSPKFDKADYIIYDFDPPPGTDLNGLAQLVLEFKDHIESFGYKPFVKTTGKKGFHILTPVKPLWSVDAVFEAAKAVALPFVEEHQSSLTLQIKKEARKGKVFLDIYRNRTSQTIIAPYSLRGVSGAPVSAPISWDELKKFVRADDYDIRTVPDRLRRGDPWQTFATSATALHLKA